MSALAILLTGIIATALMTAFMNICAAVSKRNLYTVGILTEMLATLPPDNIKRNVGIYRAVAITVHYGIGVLFAGAYFLLRGTQGYIGHLHSMEWWIIGVIYGMVGVSGWIIFIRLHPAPLRTVPWSLYLLCIFAGHLIFTFVMMWLINTSHQKQLLSENPDSQILHNVWKKEQLFYPRPACAAHQHSLCSAGSCSYFAYW